jgi:hypothetical protein
MAEPYYRIGTARSELETILYDTTKLGDRLSVESRALEAQQMQEGVPSLSSIKRSHRFPFRTEFSPVVNSANQFISHDNATNRRFTIEYGGEFSARMYQAIDFSAGTLVETAGADTILWAYCDNLIANLLVNVSYKVSTDTLYEFPGHMYYIWYQLLAPMGSRPALTRCLRECCWEWKWMDGISAMDRITEYNRTTAASVLALQHPYAPLQSYEVTHAAFTAYVPYNIFTLCNVKNAYPMVAVYSLQRTLEYSFKVLTTCINVHGLLVASHGMIDPIANNPGVFTWGATPAITATRLIVEYFVVHKDLQRMLAMNAHGYLIRQYFDDTDTLTDRTVREISVTKIIESIYILCRHNYSVVHTPIATGVTTVTLTGGVVDEVHRIDPFFIPVGEQPIDHITLSARGQTFYRNLNWEELSAVNQFLFTTPQMGTTLNHSIGVFTFAHFYYQDQHTGSYNSGFGPNLRLQWTTSAYAAADPGILNSVIQGLNMVLAYRGALTIRYT